jgi:hypothetical protein
VSAIEELLERKSSGSVLESRETDVGFLHADQVAPSKLALTSPTSGVRSVGIIRSQTQITEFGFLVLAKTRKKLLL